MHKLSALNNNSDWYEHSLAPVYEFAPGANRIVAALPSGSAEHFQKIASSLAQPYMLLYVLHTPHGEASSDRYQNPELTSEGFQEFIAKFGSYLSSDSRFDIWARLGKSVCLYWGARTCAMKLYMHIVFIGGSAI